jgi:hypothetical protein
VTQCSFQISLEEKHKDLMAERGKHERLAANITDQMYTEAQVFTKSLFYTEHIHRYTGVALQSSIGFVQSQTSRLLPTKQVHLITLLVLMIAGNLSVWHLHWLQWHTVCTKFRENWSSGLNIEIDIHICTTW